MKGFNGVTVSSILLTLLFTVLSEIDNSILPDCCFPFMMDPDC